MRHLRRFSEAVFLAACPGRGAAQGPVEVPVEFLPALWDEQTGVHAQRIPRPGIFNAGVSSQ